MKLLLDKRMIFALLVLGVLCGLLSWYLLKAYLKNNLPADKPDAIQTVSIVVPAETLQVGTRLQVEHLRIRQIPDSIFPSDIVRPAELKDILGRTLSAEIRAGHPVQWLHLLPEQTEIFSDLLAAGESAVSFVLSRESGHGGNVRLGDFIDAVDPELGIAVFKRLEIIGIEGNWNEAHFDSGVLPESLVERPRQPNLLVTVRTLKQDFAFLKQGLSSGNLLPRLQNRKDSETRIAVRTITYIYPNLGAQKELLCEYC